MSELARKSVLNLSPYVAGKPIEETQRQLGLKTVIKLASNENPLGPSPRALEAIKRCLTRINRYPDSRSFYLKRRLSQALKVGPENIVLGNGSDEIIDIIVKTFVEEDENIVTADVTFLEYKIIAEANNRKVITVPLKSFKYDLDRLAKKINKKTKLVFIANPNNPTGTYVNTEGIEKFLEGLPSHVAVVLDEAYDAFIDVKDFPRSLKYIGKRNVMILKTFSKAYGLAGLRIGYAVADKKLVSAMERVRQPFNVNILAQQAALAALDDKAFLKRTRDCVLEGKSYICRQLSALGVKYVSSVANFILFDCGSDGAGLFKGMLKEGVIVRDMKQYGLKNFVRVTIGTEKENKKFIGALKRLL